ncbi:GMC oxidoreductase [Streptomyces solisilvae]|uniref:GMC oxidoreductase n=1 Tax=Streptomyces malaysiensis TaxID=92644 RepID=UPI0036A7F16D
MFRRRPWHPTTHQSLRIADASTIPSIISGNPNSTVLAIANEQPRISPPKTTRPGGSSLRPIDE